MEKMSMRDMKRTSLQNRKMMDGTLARVVVGQLGKS
jgi:hypothetical protein